MSPVFARLDVLPKFETIEIDKDGLLQEESVEFLTELFAYRAFNMNLYSRRRIY